MFTRNDDVLDFEVEMTVAGPVRQRRSVRTSAAKRSRIAARRKTKSSRQGAKIGGIHQRSNKRMNW